MPKSSNGQISFNADDEVSKLLSPIDVNQKDRVINAALIAWFESNEQTENYYDSTLQSFIDWLKVQRDPIIVPLRSGKQIALSRLLQKFAHQDNRRPPRLSWDVDSEAASEPS